MEATILHADVDAFFASVEQRDDPRLRGRPTIVGSGVVMAASYEARAFGVRGAMGGGQARRLCPHAVVVQPRWPAYVEASRAVFEVFEDTAPVVEGLSMEEAFLDVRGLERISGAPAEIATRLRRRVRERVGLPLSVGVATSRVVAKMASRSAKPDGLLAVPPGGELAFLHPIRVERVWGVGPATAEKLRRRGIATVGQIAGVGEAQLMSTLGRATGRRLHALAHNLDFRPLRPGRRRRSFGSQSALGRSSRSPEPSTRWSSHWSTASRAGCGRRAASGAPWCCGCASVISRERAGRARCPVRRRRPRRSWPWCGGCWRRPRQ